MFQDKNLAEPVGCDKNSVHMVVIVNELEKMLWLLGCYQYSFS